MQEHNTSAMPFAAHGAMYSDLEHIFMVITLIAIITAALVGNIMVCIIIYRKRRLRTRTSAYIINLAVADLGVVFLCMPFSLVTCLFHNWVLGDVICNLNGLFNIVFTQSSLLTLIAIGIDKYFAIVWPLRRLMTTRRTMGLLCWTWLQPIAMAVVPFIGVTKFEFKAGSTQCGVAFPKTVPQTIYGVLVSILAYCIPLAIMAYAYVKIFHSSLRSARRISRVSVTSATSTNSVMSNKRVAVTVMILIIVFFLCWTPYFVYAAILTVNHDLSTNQHVLNLGKGSYWMAFLCSALNPYIYGARNPKIRKEFNLLMCCLCPCFITRLKARGCSNSGSKGSWDSSGQNGYNPMSRGSTPWASPAVTPRSQAPDIALLLEKLSKKSISYLNNMYKDISEEDNEDSIETSDKSENEIQQLRFDNEPGIMTGSGSSDIHTSESLDIDMYRGRDEEDNEDSAVEHTPPAKGKSESQSHKLRFVDDVNFNKVNMGFCADDKNTATGEKEESGACAGGNVPQTDLGAADATFAANNTDYMSDGSYIVTIPSQSTVVKDTMNMATNSRRKRKQYSLRWIESSL